jgi:hypothetical protein
MTVAVCLLRQGRHHGLQHRLASAGDGQRGMPGSQHKSDTARCFDRTVRSASRFWAFENREDRSMTACPRREMQPADNTPGLHPLVWGRTVPDTEPVTRSCGSPVRGFDQLWTE